MAARTASPVHYTSGRGGAGNMSERRNSGTTSDLVTPTIKSDMYTTGRGGSGNITKLENVENARKAQDVDGPVHRDPEDHFHYGRGGAANVAKVSEEQRRQAHERNQRKSDDPARSGSGAEKGLGEKIKEKVGLGSKK